MQQYEKFQSVFGQSLDDFWLDNVFGLDLDRFNKAFVQTTMPNFIRAVKDKYGTEGVQLVKRLVPKTMFKKRAKKTPSVSA